MMKAWWGPEDPQEAVPPLPMLAEAVILRAARLSPIEIDQLDRLDRPRRQGLIVAWDVLREATQDPVNRGIRLDAGRRAWRAAVTSLTRAGVAEPDHEYWRATHSAGAGACRAARFAACAIVAPSGADPDLVGSLLRGWVEVVGDTRW